MTFGTFGKFKVMAPAESAGTNKPNFSSLCSKSFLDFGKSQKDPIVFPDPKTMWNDTSTRTILDQFPYSKIVIISFHLLYNDFPSVHEAPSKEQ